MPPQRGAATPNPDLVSFKAPILLAKTCSSVLAVYIFVFFPNQECGRQNLTIPSTVFGVSAIYTSLAYESTPIEPSEGLTPNPAGVAVG